jgi:hypothetical protein
MAAIGNISLPDAQATPVTHIFSPANTTGDAANWEDRSASAYIGFNKISMKLTRPTGQPSANGSNRNLRLYLKLETPKLENVTNSTVSGIAPAPTISYRPVVELTMTFPERCQTQDRKDIRKFLLGLLADPQVVDFIENYAVPY